MEELKVCPFCGGKADLFKNINYSRSGIDYELGITWKVRCQNCGIEKTGHLTKYHITKEGILALENGEIDGRAEAIAKWNNRAV